MAAFLSSKLKEEEKPRFDTTDCVNGGKQRNGERRKEAGKGKKSRVWLRRMGRRLGADAGDVNILGWWC